MQLQLIAVGKQMPPWVQTGFTEYAKRLPSPWSLPLTEISRAERTKNADLPRLISAEGKQMLAAIPQGHYVIALDVKGTSWSTEQLAEKLSHWQMDGVRGISFLVGGPEGLAPACLERADMHWSLSALTLPHPLVRVILAEQLYRAWSVLQGHPYHR